MIKIDVPSDEPARVYTARQRTNRNSNLDNIRATVRYNKSLPADGVPRELAFSDTYWKKFAKVLYEEYQGRKCAYCEREIKDEIDNRLEHYRPKGKITSPDDKDFEIKPGYWWLCYDWRNYVVSCERCNSRKSSHFPLINEDNRVVNEEPLNDNGILGAEKPILINPRYQKPNEYFSYDIELLPMGKIRLIPTTKEGNGDKAEIAKKNIEILNLDKREGIREERAIIYKQLQDHLISCEHTYDNLNRVSSDPEENQERVTRCKNMHEEVKGDILLFFNNTQHLGMCRWYIDAHINRYRKILPKLYD